MTPSGDSRGLTDLLLGLSRDTDRRVLVLAAAACARLDLPKAMSADPYNRTVLETAESWARGERPLELVREVAKRARKARGGMLQCQVIELITAGAASSKGLESFCNDLPVKVWYASAAGIAWTRDPANRDSKFSSSPVAVSGIDGVRDSLLEIAREIVGEDHRDVERAIDRHGRVVDRLGQRFAEPAPTEPLPEGPPIVIVDQSRMAERAPRKSSGDPILIEAVVKHVRKHVGAPSATYHDSDQRWVHLDVHIVRPTTAGQPAVLVTSGMAERPLEPFAVAGVKRPRLWTELVMVLPADWRFDGDALADPLQFWTIGWLRSLGRGPHKTGIGYSAGETVGPMQRPDVPKPIRFDGVLLMASSRLPPLEMVGRAIQFLAVCPLLPEELEDARIHGAKAVLEAIRKIGDPEVIDPSRPRAAL